jgi:hypothetical protein
MIKQKSLTASLTCLSSAACQLESRVGYYRHFSEVSDAIPVILSSEEVKLNAARYENCSKTEKGFYHEGA